MSVAIDIDPVVTVDELCVSFPRPDGSIKQVVSDLSFELMPGDRVALVGESGSGKTMVGLSLLGLAPPTAIVDGDITVEDTCLTTADSTTLRRLRGHTVSMVFQDPLTSLNPVRTIGSQLIESVRRHQGVSKREARTIVIDALTQVGVPVPEERLSAYPHELSGGLRQRVMIALALVNNPALIVADEPTTALDATIQAQILEVFRTGLDGRSLILITHDLAVAAEVCNRAMVMYAGQIVETGEITSLLAAPRHPYTRALLAAVPSFDESRPSLVPITGAPPADPGAVIGCRFAPRCPLATEKCREVAPALVDGVACWYAKEPAHV